MSTYTKQKATCAICGSTNEYNVLMSTNTFGGSMDLDTRPPEMQRSTMHTWIHECPNCGYVSKSVSDETTITSEYLKSEEYTSCNGLKIKSDLAKKFYRYYLISLKDDSPKDAFYAALRAAWASDDEKDTEAADIFRSYCLELLPVINSNSENHTLVVVKADLLRRTGRFEEVISEYKDMKFEDGLLQKIVEFQVEKARNKDSAVYRVGDVESAD